MGWVIPCLILRFPGSLPSSI